MARRQRGAPVARASPLPVPSGKTTYIPMALRIAELPEKIRKDIDLWRRRKVNQA